MIGYTTFAFFVCYFGITFLLYSIMPKRAKWVVLLLGSYVFYFVSSKGHVIPLIVATLVVWAIGLWLQKLNDTMRVKRKNASKPEKKIIKAKYLKYKQWVLALGILSTFGILLICKYTNFFIDTTNSIFSSTFKNVHIIQPLGISFYTLQAISYITDIHHGKYKAEKNPFRVSLYLAFMLTIVEGPVARYDQLGVQLKEPKRFDTHNFIYGAVRVIWGLFKKVVIADRAVSIANAVFNDNGKYTGFAILFGIAFYTLQLYFEFSGIMDVMCGLGEMMGIKMPENFNRPFFAKTINEFWQRWHITLGSWLRDYIFYPISLSKFFKGLSKSAKKRFNSYYAMLIPTSVALFFVWFGNGFWHGAGWKYVIYGLYYYVLMMLGMFFEPVFKKICCVLKINRESKLFGLFQIIRTTIIVNFGMLIFRADNLNVALSMFKSIFINLNLSSFIHGRNNGFGLDLCDYAVVMVGILLVFLISLLQEKGINVRERISKLPYILKFVIFMSLIFSVIIFGAYGEGYGIVDLIYANF